MARNRDVILLAAFLTGAFAAPGLAASTPTMPATAASAVPAQYYQPERRYYAPPPRRRVCWTEYRRVYVGYDRYGRRLYRRVPRRVCGYR